MAIKICLQSGHWGKAGAGAPEEQANNKRITDRLSAMLRERGFEVTQTDYYAYNDPKVTKVDFSLFLALHCDMNYVNDNGSGFADFPQPATDGATTESQRIVGILNDVYFKESGITYKNHSNENTRYYYMWKYLTAKTPCALIEMGQSIDPHDKVLLANTDLIASSIARALCKAFNVAYDITPKPPVVVEPPKPVVITDPATIVDLGIYGKITLAKVKSTLDEVYTALEKQETALNSASENKTILENTNKALVAKIEKVKSLLNE